MQNSTLKILNVSQFTSDNVIFNGQGVSKECLPKITSNIDYKILNDSFITGAKLKAKNVTFNDTASFQVVDVDGILVPAGTVLNQFIKEWSMVEDSQTQINFQTEYPGKILTGLYLRIVYKSYGYVPVNISVDYYLHEALI